MRHLLRTASVLAPALLCSGCIILPIPHRRLHEYGVDGRIARPDSSPIVGARVTSVSDETHFAESDAKGNFRLPPEYGWHGGMMFGVLSLSVWPGLDVVDAQRKIIISAEGFESRELTISGHELEVEVDDDYLIPESSLKLTPKPVLTLDKPKSDDSQ